MAEQRRNLDELTTQTERAEVVHPGRALAANHFHTDGIASTDGGLWLVMICALLFVPYMMAVLFYPVPSLIGGGIVAALSLAVYEGVLIWKKRRLRV